MTGLDKIIEHIKQDAQATAEAKIAEAKAEAQELLAKAAEEEKALLAEAKEAADAALAASMFHYGEVTVDEVKKYLKERKIPVRY